MKKCLYVLLSLALVFTLAVSLAGCDSDTPTSEQPDTETTTPDETTPTGSTTPTTPDETPDTKKPPVDLVQHLTKPEDFAWETATTVECEVQGYTSAGATFKEIANPTTGYTFGYMYLKKTVKDPYIKIPFTVSENGTYEFILELMAYNSDLPRTALIQVDESGDFYYIRTEHGNDRHLTTEYYTGITAELTAGEHFMYLYLGDDFDDYTVKSVFFDKFSYAKK